MLQIYGLTDIGLIRKENQDCFSIKRGSRYTLAVLCDGMGGENSGKEAAEKTCSVFIDRFTAAYTPKYSLNSVRNLLVSCVNIANSTVYTESQRDFRKSGMGTTCVAAFVCDDLLQLVNVGDSRAYYISEKTIKRITRDHTVSEMLLASGEITEDEVMTHPQRNYLTRAVGVAKQLNPDYFEMPFGLGDAVLLCSDGLTKYCSDDEIFRFAHQTKPSEIPEKFISTVNERGGKDNTTVVILYNY